VALPQARLHTKGTGVEAAIFQEGGGAAQTAPAARVHARGAITTGTGGVSPTAWRYNNTFWVDCSCAALSLENNLVMDRPTTGSGSRYVYTRTTATPSVEVNSFAVTLYGGYNGDITALATDPQTGDIYVGIRTATYPNPPSYVRKYDKNGTLLAELLTAHGANFIYVSGLAVGGGYIYIADIYANSVYRFSSTDPTGSTGRARYTATVYPTGVAVGSNNLVYILEGQSANRVQVTTLDFVFYSSYTTGNLGYSPQGIALDSFNNVYIADTQNKKIKILTAGLVPIDNLSSAYTVSWVVLGRNGAVYFTDNSSAQHACCYLPVSKTEAAIFQAGG
jgi:hypothetical protein